MFQKDNRPFVDYSYAVNGMNYSDFIAHETGAFYIFYYSTTSCDLGFRFYDMAYFLLPGAVYATAPYQKTSYPFSFNTSKDFSKFSFLTII